MKEFLSEHWVLLYGFIMWGLGAFYGYFEGKRKSNGT